MLITGIIIGFYIGLFFSHEAFKHGIREDAQKINELEAELYKNKILID